MTKAKTTLIQKDPKKKGTAPNNNRLTTCQPMMWKILTAKIREEIYYTLISCWLFPKERKGCWKRTRRTGYLLYIDQHILNESNHHHHVVLLAQISLTLSCHLLYHPNKMEKSSYGMDWQEKGLWHGPQKLDNTLS